MRSLIRFIIASAACVQAMQSHAQVLSSCASGHLSVSETTRWMSDPDWNESIEDRTLFSSLWRNSDGRIRSEFSAVPIHYTTASGEMRRISAAPEFSDSSWIAAEQAHPVRLNSDGSFFLGLGTSQEFSCGYNIHINGDSYTPHNLSYDSVGNFVTSFLSATISKQFQFRENALKYNYVLSEKPTLVDDEWRVSEEIILPEGSILQADIHRGKVEGNVWRGDLIVLQRDSTESGRIRGAMCFDSNGDVHLAGYLWEKLAGENRWRITTCVENEWLASPATAYPVVIDPLVVGPVSNWSSGIMPSCYVPQYNPSVIQVTIPGGISVTALMVTASFYADPFSGAIMSDGSMYFSTSCDRTVLYELGAPEGNLPGTAYLDNANLRVPMMCCFTPSCSPTTFELTMHLGRYWPQGTCNAGYVYYDPFTQWPFRAYVEGHTVESSGVQWSVPSLPICSNICETEGTARIRYGVPPYTLTHPWMSGSVVVEEPEPCDLSAKSTDLPLTIPNCPDYCPDYVSMSVAPPTITDACGNTVTGMPVDVLNIKPAPEINIPEPPIEICEGETSEISLNSCPDESIISWSGNGFSGEGNMIIQFDNNSGNTQTYSFQAAATLNGCTSPAVDIPVDVLPSPVVAFSISPSPPIINQAAALQDQSNPLIGQVTQWSWSKDEIEFGTDSEVPVTFETVGTHVICLEIETDRNCVDSTCIEIIVIPAEIRAPNIFTPNNDGTNDTLEFEYLELFPNNEIEIFNRWGESIYRKSPYKNDWGGDGLEEGVYFYMLKTGDGQSVENYFHLTR